MRGILGLALGALLAALAAVSPSLAQDYSGSGSNGGLAGIFDEVRVGTVFSVQPNDDSGVIVSGQLYFRAFGPPRQNYFANTLLRPRIFVGGNLATADDGVSQVYAGLDLALPDLRSLLPRGELRRHLPRRPAREPPGEGLDLGCHWLFHERLGLGFDIGQHWTLLASADHSSHAHLCDGGKAGNSGITHAGVYAGYRF